MWTLSRAKITYVVTRNWFIRYSMHWEFLGLPVCSHSKAGVESDLEERPEMGMVLTIRASLSQGLKSSFPFSLIYMQCVKTDQGVFLLEW